MTLLKSSYGLCTLHLIGEELLNEKLRASISSYELRINRIVSYLDDAHEPLDLASIRNIGQSISQY